MSPKLANFTMLELFALVLLAGSVRALCPNQCVCNDGLLKATCSSGALATVPITLNPRLKELYLNENRIRELTSNSLNFYNQLEILSLSSNKLVTLGRRSFESLSRLQLLFLDTNSILDIEDGSRTFHGLSSLLVLSLARNSLSTVGPGAFQGMSALEELDLSSNLLESLELSAFAGLFKLKVLSLRDNRLRHIVDSSHLATLSASLIKLDLGINLFEGLVLELDALSGLYNLQDLRVDLCGLSGLRVGSNFDVRVDLPSLRSIDLRGNRLTTISGQYAELLRSLKCLDLRRNPLNCNCSLKQFKALLENITASETGASALSDFECPAPLERLLEDAHCSEPPAAKNSSLASVDFEDHAICYDSFATELEESFAIVWFSLLLCSAVVTLVLVYIKTSLFRPNYPKLITTDVDQLWPESPETVKPLVPPPLPVRPPNLVQNPMDAVHHEQFASNPRLFAVCRGLSAKSPLLIQVNPRETNCQKNIVEL